MESDQTIRSHDFEESQETKIKMEKRWKRWKREL